MKRLILCALLFVFILSCIHGNNTTGTKKQYIVGISNSPPFIIKDGDGFQGVSVDLWESIASELQIDYEFRECDFPELFKGIQNGSIDVSINPLTVTPGRLEQFDFTQPFYVTNLGIAVKTHTQSEFMTFVSTFFSFDLLKILILLFLILLVFGIILWVIERNKNPGQFHRGFRGIGDGIWWSAVTMTTVGYGDKAPKTGFGRFFSIIWMFAAVVIVSSFTASIASSLTVHRLQSDIHSIEDLRGVRVGTIKESATTSFLDDYHITYVAYETLLNGLEDLNVSEVDAFVFDETIMSYLIKEKHLHESISVIPSVYCKEYYSFASHSHELIDQINPLLISMIESYQWKEVLKKYNLSYNE